MSSILNELKQNRPFPNPGLETGVSLLRTVAQLRRLLDAEMNVHGVTLQQFNVLRILRGAGTSMPTMDIADRMVEHVPGITRLLGRLEEKGLISRHRPPEDGRKVLVSITEEGSKVLDRIGEPTDFLAGGEAQPLTREELASLSHLLDKARKAMQEFS